MSDVVEEVEEEAMLGLQAEGGQEKLVSLEAKGSKLCCVMVDDHSCERVQEGEQERVAALLLLQGSGGQAGEQRVE